MLPSSVPPPRRIKLEGLRAHSGDRTQRTPLLSCRGSSPGHLTVGGENERRGGQGAPKGTDGVVFSTAQAGRFLRERGRGAADSSAESVQWGPGDPHQPPLCLSSCGG